jgi:Ca-activated chloride channel family protein
MKRGAILFSLLLVCIGLSQIEEIPAAKKAEAEAPAPSEALDDIDIREGDMLSPQEITYSSGKTGWKVIIPGNRPLATVAYDGGLVFVGGGYGSYEFYAIDAVTGELAWMYKTGDDGPTAAIVKNGYVIFNTESCIIYVLEARTGEKVWEKWLGDPLMSQPAADEKHVYMAYPGSDGHHHLACMTLDQGKEVWDVRIAGDLISAPIIHKGSVYITCFDGTVYRYNSKSGELVWSQKKNATCAPVVHDDRIFLSLRQSKEVTADSVVQYEGMASLKKHDGAQEQSELWALREAPYLVYGRASANSARQAELDASVGFSSAPSTAKLYQAQENVGQGSVVGCWAFQGSRPVIHKGFSFNAMGNQIQSVDIAEGTIRWSKTFVDVSTEGLGGRFFSPPSYANTKLFFGAGTGEVFCLDEKTGKLLWKEKVAGSVSFQPAVARGMVFVSCDNGSLYAIPTGDTNDDGWYMWGGNAEHNK